MRDDLAVIRGHADKLRHLARELREDSDLLSDEGLRRASATVCRALEGLAAVLKEAEEGDPGEA